jgi:hypothetical protein
MTYDDDLDDLDRALSVLPLEEPPRTLHARILAATVYRPAPVVRAWEIWLLGSVIALCAWLVWAVLSAPLAAEKIGAFVVQGVQQVGLTSNYTMLWLGIGASAAWWISQLSFPQPGRVREAR